jgi:hypothetical protein
VQLVYGVRIRLCLCAIILIKQCDSWQGVSLLTLCLLIRSLPDLSISSYLSAIERRVENVELTLQSLQQNITGLSNNGHGKNNGAVSSGQSSVTGAGQLEVQEVADANDSVDAMGALVFANEEESGFFGKRPVVICTITK